MGIRLTVLFALAAPAPTLAQDEAVLFVAPDGNDAWSGRFEQPNADATDGPFATPERAQRAVRAASPSGDVVVQVGEGVYRLDHPLAFGPDDGGDAERSVTWRARSGDRVVLSGGRLLADWRANDDGSWTHAAPEARVRQLFIDEERRPLARLPQEGWLRVAAPGDDGRSHFTYDPGDLAAWPDASAADVVFMHDWSTSRVAIDRIDGAAHVVHLAEPIGAWHPFFHITGFEAHPRYALENLRAAWNAPGEWILGERVHYWPREGEARETVAAVVPVLDRLIDVRGEKERPVQRLSFVGLTFSHTRAVDPPGGYAGIQAAFHEGRAEGMKPGLEVPVPCAVNVTRSENCHFVDCRFEDLGGAALWFGTGSRDGRVASCKFSDVGANGLMVGEIHEPEALDLVSGVVCEDCTLERCGVMTLGAVGIWVGIAEHVIVRHNEVRDLPYTGISLGWIWDPRPSPSRGHRIEHNHIHHVMQALSDGGGIYTIGRHAETLLRLNLIHDVPRHAGRAQSNGFFIDEGSCELVIEGNMVHSVSGSPVRFHKSGTNTLRENVLVTEEGTPPFAYNACSADQMVFELNSIVTPRDRAATTDVEKLAGPR